MLPTLASAHQIQNRRPFQPPKAMLVSSTDVECHPRPPSRHSRLHDLYDVLFIAQYHMFHPGDIVRQFPSRRALSA